MYIVSPLSRCASREKQDRVCRELIVSWKGRYEETLTALPKFLSYLTDIATVTYESEPHCFGYAWFRSTGHNEGVPVHWCRGLEVYPILLPEMLLHVVTLRADTITKKPAA